MSLSLLLGFLSFGPLSPPRFIAALSRVSFENQLNNPTDKQPLGHGISVQKIFSTLCESTAQAQRDRANVPPNVSEIKGYSSGLCTL